MPKIVISVPICGTNPNMELRARAFAPARANHARFQRARKHDRAVNAGRHVAAPELSDDRYIMALLARGIRHMRGLHMEHVLLWRTGDAADAMP